MIPDSAERDAVVEDVVDAANPSAVPGTVGPKSDPIARDDVVDVADEVFENGILVAELAGTAFALGVLLFGWMAFPRTRGDESDEELGEALALEHSPDEPGIRRVVEAGGAAGLAITPYRMPGDVDTTAELAALIEVDPVRVVSVLVFEVGGQVVLAVLGGGDELDPARLAEAAGAPEAVMLDPRRVRDATGFDSDGVPPFGLAERLPTYVEESLLDQPSLWAPAGTTRDRFELEPTTLVTISNATVTGLRRMLRKG
ncbi:MAG: YbaK/EbsC family protein [Microthrixaceae bacterium]